MKKTFTVVYTLLLIAVIGYSIKYGLNVFLARNLSSELYGEYSIAVKLLNIMVSISLFGTDIGAKRFLAQYIALNKKNTAADYIQWNIKLISVTFLIFLALALFSMMLMHILHVLGIKSIGEYHLVVYMLWIVPFAAFTTLLCSYLLISNHIYIPTIVLTLALYLLQLILFTIIIIFFGLSLDAMSIVSVIFITFLLLATLASLASNRDILSMLKSGLQKINYPQNTHIEWLRTSSQLIVSNVIFMIIAALDLIIVQSFITNKNHVGYYAAVLTICGFIWLPSTNLYQLLKSKAGKLLTTAQGKTELQEMLNETNSIVISLSLVITTIIIYFSSTILSHFGQEYAVAKFALIFLAIGACLGAISRSSTFLLVYAGYEHLSLTLTIFELIGMVILTVPATIFYGINGTALSTTFILGLNAIIRLVVARRKLGLRILIFI